MNRLLLFIWVHWYSCVQWNSVPSSVRATHCNFLAKYQRINFEKCTHTHSHTTILQLSEFCPGQHGWAGTRRNIHSLTPIVVISHPLSSSSIQYDPWHPSCSFYIFDSVSHNLSQVFFDLPLDLEPSTPLRTPYISSTSHCLLFTAHAYVPLQPVLL